MKRNVCCFVSSALPSAHTCVPHSFKSLGLQQEIIHGNSDLPITRLYVYWGRNPFRHKSNLQEKCLIKGVDLNKNQDSVHYLCLVSNLGIQGYDKICIVGNTDHLMSPLRFSALHSTRISINYAKDYSEEYLKRVPFPFYIFWYKPKCILQNILHSINL